MALNFIPYTGYIKVSVIEFTTIPCFIAFATYHLGFKGAMVVSVSFGVGACIVGYTILPSPLANPLFSILPRIILGFVIYGIYKLLKEIKFWKFVLLGALCPFFNTLLMTLFIFMFRNYATFFSGTFMAWIILIYINFFVEIGCAIFLSIIFYRVIIFQIARDAAILKAKW